jgi:prophage DNA circulation protein
MSFDPALPEPYKENWRKAYHYDDEDTPRLSTYQPPEGDPIPFVFDTFRLSGGQSVDTAEYPFFGFWSSTPLNEKPQAITVNGFIRGDTYIKNRNAFIEALRSTTDDDTPGFLDLPLWGRFPIVVVSYDVEEKSQQNGQCSVSVTLTRAGVTVEERWKFDNGGFDFYQRTEVEAGKVKEAAVNNLDKTLAGNTDTGTIASGFNQFKASLIGIIGRIQGAVSALDKMTNEVTGITNLIAQGVRAPRELAQALFSAADSIAAGIMDIKNSVGDTAAYFTSRDNTRNALLQFFSNGNYTLNLEAVTVKQTTTKRAVENLYRTMSLCIAGQMLVRLESPTYQQVKNYWSFYEKLEAGVDQSNPAVYRAVEDMRIATARGLAARSFDAELVRHIGVLVPLLYLAHHLGCENEKLRALNNPEDSFVMRGDIIYV